MAAAMAIASSAQAQSNAAIPPALVTPDKLDISLGTLKFKDGAPSKDTVSKVYDYLDLMHGVEAFVNAYQGASVESIFRGLRSLAHRRIRRR